MALDLAKEFNAMRKQSYAFSHSWDLVIPQDGWNKVTNRNDDFKANLKKQPDLISLQNAAVGYPASEPNLTLRCKSATIPKSTVKTERVKVYGMSTQVVLEDETEGSITLVFFEDENHVLYRRFSTWKDLGATHRTYAQGGRTYNTELKSRIALNYVQLRLLQPNTKKNVPKLIFELYGVQPTRVELSNLDNNINFMTLTVTLKYDCFEVE